MFDGKYLAREIGGKLRTLGFLDILAPGSRDPETGEVLRAEQFGMNGTKITFSVNKHPDSYHVEVGFEGDNTASFGDHLEAIATNHAWRDAFPQTIRRRLNKQGQYFRKSGFRHDEGERIYRLDVDIETRNEEKGLGALYDNVFRPLILYFTNRRFSPPKESPD